MSESLKISALPPTLHLDILMYQREGVWVGHCLQLDLVHSGLDRDEVYAGAQKVCVAQVVRALSTNQLDQLFRPPAPELVSLMLKAKAEGVLTVSIQDHEECPSLLQFQRVFSNVAPARMAA